MSGPAKCAMYALRPTYNIPENIDLPKNMYKLRKIQSSGEPINDIVHAIQDKVKKILKSYSDAEASLEKRWDLVLEQLAELKAQLADIRKSIEPSSRNVKVPKVSCPGQNQLNLLDGAVIRANPASPPFSLPLVRRLYKEELNINMSSHIHSTVKTALPDSASSFSSKSTATNGVPKLNLTVIWKDDLLDTELVVDPVQQTVILGEVNILRYLARLGLHSLNYDTDEISQLQTDSILDTCHRLLHVRTVKEKTSIVRNLNGKLGRNLYYGGSCINISDIAVWSALKQTNLATSADLSQNMAKWVARMESSIFE